MAKQVVQETEDLGLDEAYPLTKEQITSAHEQGWAFLPGLLGPEVVDGIRTRLQSAQVQTRTAATAYRRLPDGEAAVDVKNSNFSHAALAWREPYFHRIATSKRVAGTAVRMMKQQAALLAQDISFIKPGGGGPTQPHQDYSYLPFDRRGELTLWIALVDISEDMGPLYYLEKSHNEGPLGLHGGKDIREQYPHLFESPIVAGRSLRAGDAQVHWDMTVHGAVPNSTENTREAYVVRYIRTDTFYSGIGHPHFDVFELEPGTQFAASGKFPLVGPEGLIES
jgi:ectoine hydroxylase-related dioxygenase (phytanoyl-CoA dioxygenase family)